MKLIHCILFFLFIFIYRKYNIEKFTDDDLKKKYIVVKKPVKYKILNNFIEKNDIEYLIRNTKNYLQNSTVVNDNETINSWRTSKTAFINSILGDDDLVLKKLKNKIKKIVGKDERYFEDINLTYYKEGDRYKEHHDYFNPNFSKSEKEILKNGNQRMITIFVYLKNAIEGGETYFPIINKKFKLKEGDAIMWENAFIEDDICYMNYNTLHEGLPPLKGEKYGLNIWIKEKPN